MFITQPYLLSLHPDCEMNIVWIGDCEGHGIVEYGADCSLGSTASAECYELKGFCTASDGVYLPDPDDNPTVRLWQYIVKLEGLRRGETVYYRCRHGEDTTPIYHFRTSPEKGQPFSFAQLSDLQGKMPCEDGVYKIGCMKPDFILYSGDAISNSRRAAEWFGLDDGVMTEEERARAFFPCLQQTNSAELLQYCPIFICPGNHEVDDLRIGLDPEFSRHDENWTWSIFMQLFRPLYPDKDYSLSGKRWYTAEYGDMRIISLSIQRWASWGALEYCGWRIADDFSPGSPQREWLEETLANNDLPYTWVIQHWHIMNKGSDVQVHLCQPRIDENGAITYPDNDEDGLMRLFESSGVNAVSYGHSHVYERYRIGCTNYIEAAHIGVCYREDDAPLHPSGIVPIIEDNSQKSFLIVQRCEDGLVGRGYYSSGTPQLFDEYVIAGKIDGEV